MHIVFRITGSKSYSYTGYCVADEKSPLDRFLVGAKRHDDERSDKRFFKYHGSNEETLKYEILASTETEWEAYLIRNEVRSSDPYSFSGPTNWRRSARTCIERKSRTSWCGNAEVEFAYAQNSSTSIYRRVVDNGTN